MTHKNSSLFPSQKLCGRAKLLGTEITIAILLSPSSTGTQSIPCKWGRIRDNTNCLKDESQLSKSPSPIPAPLNFVGSRFSSSCIPMIIVPPFVFANAAISFINLSFCLSCNFPSTNE